MTADKMGAATETRYRVPVKDLLSGAGIRATDRTVVRILKPGHDLGVQGSFDIVVIEPVPD